ncbi:glycosyltransferase family 87 protein [Corynebacterium hindlerae]|uniref:glycosyltransferase family 87 protein n=1 Tax=Corynebacterium hindlerae TaxID=699041 RepID=UPI001FCAB3B9|nr:glycosyltransferase 87 family protein [Corynebacterium hindlerae]
MSPDEYTLGTVPEHAKQSVSQRVSPAATEPMARGFIEFLGGPLGRHAAVGTQRWWTPLRVFVLTSLVFLAFGFLSKTNCLMGKRGDAGVTLDWSGNRQYVSACYNDIVPLFGVYDYAHGTFPYAHSWLEGGTTRYMEYPVLTGLFQWVCALVGNAVYRVVDAFPGHAIPQVTVYFMVTALVLAACWTIAVKMVAELAGNRVWDTVLMAASPVVAVHAFSNWDILPVLCVVAALVAVKRSRPGVAGVWIGLGTAFKLWPLFILGAYLVLALRGRNFVPWVKMTLMAAMSWLVVNLPVLALYPQAWNEFFRLNRERGAEWTTVYAVLTRMGVPSLTPGQLNFVSFALFGLFCLAVLWIGLRAPHTPRVAQLGFLIVAGFLLCNKVWSPQYSLWLVPLAVLALPQWRLLLSWMLSEAILWPILTWHMMGEDKLGAPAELLNAAVLVRDGFVVVMCVLIIRTMLGLRADKVTDVHEGRDPLAGPFRLSPRLTTSTATTTREEAHV